jgi:hypothetical protein
MGLGFVVARFGLVLRELAGVGGAAPRSVSTAFGVAFVLSGALLLVLATLRYQRLANDILHGRVRWDPRLGVLLTGLLCSRASCWQSICCSPSEACSRHNNALRLARLVPLSAPQ